MGLSTFVVQYVINPSGNGTLFPLLQVPPTVSRESGDRIFDGLLKMDVALSFILRTQIDILSENAVSRPVHVG